MSLRITRPTLMIMLVATAALGACSNSPTAPTRNLNPGVRSLDVLTDPPTCKDGGWIGSGAKC